MSIALTKAAIEITIIRAKNDKAAQVELLDDREPGLRFRAGQRSAGWSLMVRLRNGQRSRIKLGAWPGMGIADARNAARDLRAQIDRGIDPNEEKRISARQAAIDARNRTTLKQVLDIYDTSVLSQHRRGAQTRRALDGKNGLLTTLASRQPASITRAEISDLVRKHARSAPISANRKLAYASAFFNWCVEEAIVEESPARKVRKPARENERDRFHTLDELKEIWVAAGTLGYPFQQLYRLLSVLPMRRDEIAAMPVADLTLGEGERDAVWLLPAARTKQANALRVPLSPLARAIIVESLEHEDRPKGSAFLFTTTGDTPVSGFTKAKRRLDKAITAARSEAGSGDGVDGAAGEPMPHWTIHDLRTTFNTHACETLGVPPHVADRILNHVATATRSKVMRVYNKSELIEPRRAALADWAELIRAITTSTEA